MDDREGVRPSACLACGYVIDAASEIDGDTPYLYTVDSVNGREVRPKAGDFSLCIGCGVILVWGPEGTFDRVAREADLRRLDRSARRSALKMQALIRVYRRQRGH